MRFHSNNPLVGCLGQLCITDWSMMGAGRGLLGALPSHPQFQEAAFVGYQDKDNHPVGADSTISFGDADWLPVFVRPDGTAIRLGRGRQATSNSDFLVDADTQKFLVITDSPTMFANLQVPIAEDVKGVLAQGPLAIIREQASYAAFPRRDSDENTPFVLLENLKPGATIVIGRNRLSDSIGVDPTGQQILRYYYWIGFSKDYREELAEVAQQIPTTPTLPPAGPSVQFTPAKKPAAKEPASKTGLYIGIALALGIGIGVYYWRREEQLAT